MSTRGRAAPLGLLLLASVSGAGCALTSKSDPIVPRFFSPEQVEATGVPPGASVAGLELRLGRVNAGVYMKDKIVFRDSAYEVGYYEELRWTEKPEIYVRRALTRALFHQRGVRQIVGGPGPTLEVDLLAFEEVRGSPHVARIRLSCVLHDERVVRLAQVITIDRPIPESKGGPGDPFVKALAEALGAAVDTVAERVTNELRGL